MDSNFNLQSFEIWEERGMSHSPSSLNRLEKCLPKSPKSPRVPRSPLSFKIFQDPTDSYNDKPLPPAPLRRRSSVDVIIRPSAVPPMPPIEPRRPSSVYTSTPDNVGMREPDYAEDLLPPHIFLQPATYGASTSELPRPNPLEAKVERIAFMRRQSEMVAPRQARPDDLQDIGAIRDIYDNPDTRISKLSMRNKEANEQAEDYQAILPARSSVMPTFNTSLNYFNQDSIPDPLSSRIIDVVDQSLMPPPLSFRSSDFTDLSRATSQFSSSSSSSSSSPHTSLRARAKKALHMTKPSLTLPSVTHPSLAHRRLSSYASDRRRSVQHSLSQMYDTLNTLTPSKPSRSKPSKSPRNPKPNAPKTSLEVRRRRPSLQHSKTNPFRPPKPTKPTLPRSTTAPSKSAHIPRELRSPAIPITVYQHLGKKAWEPVPKSPKPRLARKTTDYFSLRKRSPVRRRFATPGEEKEKGLMGRFGGKEKVEMTRDEKRREDLKKKIVVVGLGRPM